MENRPVPAPRAYWPRFLWHIHAHSVSSALAYAYHLACQACQFEFKVCFDEQNSSRGARASAKTAVGAIVLAMGEREWVSVIPKQCLEVQLESPGCYIEKKNADGPPVQPKGP